MFPLPLTVVFGVTALLCLIARIWARFFLVRNWGADDVIIIFAFAFLVVLDVCMTLSYELYFSSEDPTDWVRGQLCFFLICTCGIFGASLTKISIVLFYKRVLARSSSEKKQRIMTGVICLFAIYTIVISLVYIFTCRPVDSYWLSQDPSYVGDYTCYNDAYGNVSSAVVGAMADIVVILLPISFLRDLAMRRKQKIALYAIFGLGSFTCAAALARAVFTILQNIEVAKPADEYNPDFDDYCSNQLLYWYIVEVNGGMICACVPALKPFFKRVVGLKDSFWGVSDKESGRFTYNGASTNSAWQRRHRLFNSKKAIELGNVEETFDETRGDAASQGSQIVLTEHVTMKGTADSIEGSDLPNGGMGHRDNQSMSTDMEAQKIPAGSIEKKVDIDVVHTPM